MTIELRMSIMHVNSLLNITNSQDDMLLQLIKESHSVNIVWNYFGLKTNETVTSEADKLVCLICIPAQGSNTSNLMNHFTM